MKRILSMLALAGVALTVTTNAHAATSQNGNYHVGGSAQGITDPLMDGLLSAAAPITPALARVTRQRDLVPIVPWRFMGYMHAQHELFLPSDNRG
ncbi:hypothetical protein OV450_5279 [Actinobacteria bacterium OV450]|nr:hypothetical protein OV450_5279 [Actinobacteria bacterium OV450]